MGPRKKTKGGGFQYKGSKSKKREVTFDPEARKEYLQGFSERKRQRRAYGLAMQKVKDRKAKLQERREAKQAELEQIEQAEQHKQDLIRERHGVLEEEATAVTSIDANVTTTTYEDVATQSHFGGQVVVTTTIMPPSDSEDDDDSPEEQKAAVDSQQRYAGNVNKYLNQLKGNMPGKKRRDAEPKHRGKHGAATMKGMGGAASLKIAQKTLSKAMSKSAAAGGTKKHGGKRKR